MTPYQEQLEREVQTINLNGVDVPRIGYQLAVHEFELKIYASGMKPHRHFKISTLKKYYGLKGNADKCLEQFKELHARYKSLCM